MVKFDTKVQFVKYQVLKEVAKYAFNDKLLNCFTEIPSAVTKGPKPTMRCCIYKERAITTERIKLAFGGDKNNPNVIEVIDIACDECPVSGYEITDSCRGCLSHRCKLACRKDAITFDEKGKAHIDKQKCVNCGACAKVCPYTAIINKVRPCENACKVKAITRGENDAAQIDNSKCIACGACVYQCPFGAISDKSFILDVIKMFKEHNKVYAVVAPSISSQFELVKLGQVITGLKRLGFYSVIEAALGADMVAFKESNELVEKGFLTSSCCPAFVTYIEKFFPSMEDKISHNYSPMVEIASYIKEMDQSAKVVFIGPCTAKKQEFQKESVKGIVDSVITFEELQALFDAKAINLSELEESFLDNASYFGRIFARSGGLADAVEQALREQKITDFNLSAITCNGIEECKLALLRASRNALPYNFIEGMACIGGCIGGPCCLTHGPKDASQVDKYGMEAKEKTISDAIKVYLDR